MDGNNDGRQETLLIADRNGYIIGLGFDYDFDSYFVPHKRIKVEKHIIDTKFSEDEGVADVTKFAKHKLLQLYDEDDKDFTEFEKTFSDSMYDLWKIQFSESSSQLIEDASQLTFDKFMEQLTPEKVRADFMWQIASVGVAAVAGAVVAAKTHNKMYGKMAFGLVYAGMNIWKGVVDQMEQDNILKAYTYHDEDYRGKKTLSTMPQFDEVMENAMTTAILGSKQGISAPVMYETSSYTYEGQMLLAPIEWDNAKSETEIQYDKVVENVINSVQRNCNFTIGWYMPPNDAETKLESSTTYLYETAVDWMDTFKAQYNNIKLDYSLQTRNYMAYSDLEDKRCTTVISSQLSEEYSGTFDEEDLDELWKNFINPSDSGKMSEAGLDFVLEDIDVYNKLWYAENSLTFLENEISRTTLAKKDTYMDKILPYMYDYYPTLTFTDSESSSALPEFYEDYPIFVSDTAYEEGLKDRFDTIYKVWESDDDEYIRITPENSRHTLKADIDRIDVYLVTYEEGGDCNYGVTSIGKLEPGDYELEEETGKLRLDLTVLEFFEQEIEDANPNYEHSIVLEFFIEQFRSLKDTRDLSVEEVNRIAEMQAVQAALLEYYYQFQLATQTQEKLCEAAYTAVLTVLTTACISPTSIVSETFEELFVDPMVESITTSITREMGGDRYWEIVMSTITETGRETGWGVANDIMNYESIQQAQYDHYAMKSLESTNDYMGKMNSLQQEQVSYQLERTIKEQIKDTETTSVMLFAKAENMNMLMIQHLLSTMDLKQLKMFSKLSGKQQLELLIGKASLEEILGTGPRENSLAPLVGGDIKLIGYESAYTIDAILHADAENQFALSIEKKPDLSKQAVEKIRKLGRIPELLETGKYETYHPEKIMLVKDLLKELNLNAKYCGIIANGKKAIMKDLIIPEDRIVILPYLQGESSKKQINYHIERRFILKLVFAFFDLSYRNRIKLPGYFQEGEGASSGERSALSELGKIIKNFGGEFYSFSEKYFREKWIVKAKMEDYMIEKFEHFFTYSKLLNNNQRKIALTAITDYGVVRGYKTRSVVVGKDEWNICKMLQTALSAELKRFISISEMGIMFKGRKPDGKPVNHAYFVRHLHRVKQMNFAEMELNALLDWINEPIEWEYGKAGKMIKYRIQLTGTNLRVAKNAILTYYQKVYRTKGKGITYIIPTNAPNKADLEIIEILRQAYSRHPTLNPKYGIRSITQTYLFEKILQHGRNLYQGYICTGKKIPDEIIKDLLLQASDNLLKLHASEEYADLIRSLKESRPYFMYITDLNDDDISHYLKVYEPMFKEYAEQVRAGQIQPYKDGYHEDWKSEWVYKMQVKILLRMWGNRDAMTGKEFPRDKYDQIIIKDIIRHHYKISLFDNKLECWVEVQVPLTRESHGRAHNAEWESFFSRAVAAMNDNDFIELEKILREQWKLVNVKEYMNWLKDNGFI